MPLEDSKFVKNVVNSNIGIEAHICREQALVARMELMDHRLTEARMIIELQAEVLTGAEDVVPYLVRKQAQYILDLERRMREQRNG